MNKSKKNRNKPKKSINKLSPNSKASHDEDRALSVTNNIKTLIAPYFSPLNKPISFVMHRLELYQHMYSIEQFFLKEECELWIEHAENIGFVNAFQKESLEYAHRYNGRIQFEDPDLAQLIFCRLAPLLPTSVDNLSPCKCSSNIRLYRYREGQRFGRHVDESNESEEGISKFTLLIYLNGTEHKENSSREKMSDMKELSNDVAMTMDDNNNLRGGETLFYASMFSPNPVVSVQPVCGKLLLHGHGHRCLTHEGAEVLSGVKYLLRSDVLYS